MTPNLNNVMLGSQDPKALADFYSAVLGDPNPDWSDEDGGWYGFQAGDGSLAIGPHSEVSGKNPQPGRNLCTFADPDGNYFQLATPWNPDPS